MPVGDSNRTTKWRVLPGAFEKWIHFLVSGAATGGGFRYLFHQASQRS
jgi:hypothetical protein